MREQVRYPGAKFGMLTLVEKIKHHNGERNLYYWICDCDCGNRKTVIESNLRVKGGTRSCGCANIDKKHVIKSGDKFNFLEVIELSEIKNERGGAFYTQYLCRCVCGTELLVERTLLLNGFKKSCGCMARPGRPPSKQYKVKPRGTIMDFMFIGEAAERYSVSFNAVNERIKHAKSTNKLADLEARGLIKQYISAGASRGHWLVAKQLMDIWFK